MYVYYFILAFVVMLALTFFVFFSYPKSWQKNRILKIILLIQHSLGSLALGITSESPSFTKSGTAARFKIGLWSEISSQPTTKLKPVLRNKST